MRFTNLNLLFNKLRLTTEHYFHLNTLYKRADRAKSHLSPHSPKYMNT
jgi:hypothetical protein